MVHFLTLSHTFATLWESYMHFGKCEKVCEKVTPNLCVKKSGKKISSKIRKQLNKKTIFFQEVQLSRNPQDSALTTYATFNLEVRQEDYVGT
jgi:hypothetical protein